MTYRLEDALTSDLTWREAELASLKLEIVNSARGSVKQRAFLRAIWAMLYAHYEGFAVFAWTSYLDELQKLGIRRNLLSKELIALSMEPTFNLMKNNFTSDDMLKFYSQDFSNTLAQPVIFPSSLEAESNLWPDLYRRNCKRASLSHFKADENDRRLKLLVQRRNGIAHGEAIIVRDLDEYQSFETAVMLVMHELAISIIDCMTFYNARCDTGQLTLPL